MAALPTILTQLTHHAAAQVGFTARRWGSGQVNPAALRVEVERRLAGVHPTVAELTVALPNPHVARSSPLCRPHRLLPGPTRRAARRGRPPVIRVRCNSDHADPPPVAPRCLPPGRVKPHGENT